MEKLAKIIGQIEPLDQECMDAAQKRLDSLTKPQGSLGRLEELAKRLAGITQKQIPKIDRKTVVIMAGDHGIMAEGVSAYPAEVTPQMVLNFVNGGAAINVLSRHVGAEVVIVDMGVASDMENSLGVINKKIGYGTKNFARGPAMTRDEAIRCIEAGIEVIEEMEKKPDILAVGDMGIGNTTPSSAIIAVLGNCNAKEVTGRGTGIDDSTLDKKIQAIEKGISVNAPDPSDAIDVLSKVGGFEIGGIAGCILAAAAFRIPMIIDGFISTAAGLIATEIAPAAKEYIIASHNSQEIGHRLMLEKMGLKPLLDLNLRLGEGTGAALAMNIVEAGTKILAEMATFGEAAVSERIE